MSESNQLATAPLTPGFQRATSALSEYLGIEPRMMVETLKKQCFPGVHPDQITDAQLAAFISVANSMGVNPLIPGMLYAFPSKNGGIIPLSGPDAILKKLDEQIASGKLDGYECVVHPENPLEKPTHAIAKMWRRGSERPAVFTAIFSEWCVGNNPNWQMRPRHMLWLRAIKQCARQVIHGVPLDRDDMEVQEMQNVTPVTEQTPPPPEPPARPAPPPRAKKGAAAVAENAKPEPAIDVTVTTAGEKKAEPQVVQSAPQATPAATNVVQPAPQPAKEAPKPAPEPAKPAAPPAAAPAPATAVRAFLKPDEEITAVCKIKSSQGLMARAGADKEYEPSVIATVEGEFNNRIFAVGVAGAVEKAGQVVLPDAWKAGSTLRLKLIGRPASRNPEVPSVKVLSWEEAQPASPGVEME